MAVHRKCIKYVEEILEFSDLKGNKACQLGNCGFRESAKRYLIKKYGTKFRRFDSYLIYHDFEASTIDINGKRGHLLIDLGIPIKDNSLIGAFDFIIGFGLIEHIEDQYELFRNIHNLCKVGGIVVLNCPMVGSYIGHGTWTYDFLFFSKLCKACGYTILDIRMMNLKYYKVDDNKFIVYVSYSKTKNNNFIDRENFRSPYYDSIGHGNDRDKYNGCERKGINGK